MIQSRKGFQLEIIRGTNPCPCEIQISQNKFELEEPLYASPGQGLEGKSFAIEFEEQIRILSKDDIGSYPDTTAIIVPAVIAYEVLTDKHEAIIDNISLHFEIVMNSCLKLGKLIGGYCTRYLVYIIKSSTPPHKQIRTRNILLPYHSVGVGIGITLIVN